MTQAPEKANLRCNLPHAVDAREACTYGIGYRPAYARFGAEVLTLTKAPIVALLVAIPPGIQP
jgi:hypothetical protein